MSQDEVLKYMEKHKIATYRELKNYMKINISNVHKNVNKLVKQDLIYKDYNSDYNHIIIRLKRKK